jgi:hypothetical protein
MSALTGGVAVTAFVQQLERRQQQLVQESQWLMNATGDTLKRLTQAIQERSQTLTQDIVKLDAQNAELEHEVEQLKLDNARAIDTVQKQRQDASEQHASCFEALKSLPGRGERKQEQRQQQNEQKSGSRSSASSASSQARQQRASASAGASGGNGRPRYEFKARRSHQQ